MVKKFEESARLRKREGWECIHCNKFHLIESLARYCCSDNFECKICKARHKNKLILHGELCDKCRNVAIAKDWNLRVVYEWDGIFPIGNWTDGIYYFSSEDILNYSKQFKVSINNIWFSSCYENKPREFDIYDFLQDSISSDGRNDLKNADLLNDIVNNFIQKFSPYSYLMSGHRLSIPSIKKHLNLAE